MKVLHSILTLFQLVLAFMARDKNRIEYLKYLWSNDTDNNSASGHTKNIELHQHDGENRIETHNNEYSLLLER